MLSGQNEVLSGCFPLGRRKILWVLDHRDVVSSTPRLRLTTWVPSDADDLHVVHSDPETMRFVRFGRPETLAETRALVADYMAEQAARGWTRWRLADPMDELIGRAGFAEHGDGPELGFTIRRDLWGRGLASEIVMALVAWHRNYPALFVGGDLVAHVALQNHASIRVLEKAGFVRDGKVEIAGVRCASYRVPSPCRRPANLATLA